jgi:hypothetical protein
MIHVYPIHFTQRHRQKIYTRAIQATEGPQCTFANYIYVPHYEKQISSNAVIYISDMQ